MNGKARRLQAERRREIFNLSQEAGRYKYNNVVDITPSRRSELVTVCRSNGGGAEPYNYKAALDLMNNGFIKEHKNLSGYFIGTKKGYEAYDKIMEALDT